MSIYDQKESTTLVSLTETELEQLDIMYIQFLENPNNNFTQEDLDLLKEFYEKMYGPIDEEAEDYFKLENYIAKKYPTVDEVIKELSEYLDVTVYYEQEDKKNYIFNRRFYYMHNGILISIAYAYLEGNKISIVKMLPSYLLTLLGRFYEGLEDEK